MKDYKYVVGDNVFENTSGKFDGKRNAIIHCKKNDIDVGEIIELRSDTELDYYHLLKERGVKSLSIHQPMLVQQGFNNANEEFIPPVMADVPFRYVDDKGIHYDGVVGNLFELNSRLVSSKLFFDCYYLKNKQYLRLLYRDTDGQFKEFTINEANDVRKKYQTVKHKQVLTQRNHLRALQTYDRLKKLREEGRITENQTKELYKLEELYGKSQGH